MPRKSQRNARRKSKKGYKSSKGLLRNTSTSRVSVLAGKKDVIQKNGHMVYGSSLKPSNSGPFPQRMFMKHRYVDTVTLQCVVGGITDAAYSYRLNSVYDPDTTVGGHQPQGYDTMATLYNRYIVYGVSIQLEVFPTQSPIPPNPSVVCYRLSSANDGWNFAGKRDIDFLEQSMSGAAAVNEDGRPTVIDLGYITIGDVQGQTTREIMAGANFASVPGSNPSTVPLIKLGLSNVDSFAEANSRLCRITLIYHTVWDNILGQNQN